MKKTASIMVGISLLCLINSCNTQNNEKPDTTAGAPSQDPAPAASTLCKNPFMDALSKLPPKQQIEILKASNAIVCQEEYYQCIESLHTITGTIFDEYAEKHPENAAEVKEYKLSLGDLENFLGKYTGNCYDSHVKFKLTEKEGRLLAQPVLSPFKKDSSTYSIPLLRGVVKSIKKHSEIIDSIAFCKAFVDSNHDAVILKYGEVSPVYLDISVEPAR